MDSSSKRSGSTARCGSRGSRSPNDRAQRSLVTVRSHLRATGWDAASSATSASAEPTRELHVLLLVQDLDVRIVNAITGELLRELTIDPDRDRD